MEQQLKFRTEIRPQEAWSTLESNRNAKLEIFRFLQKYDIFDLETRNSIQRILSKKFQKFIRKVISHRAEHSSRGNLANHSKRRKVADKSFETDQRGKNFWNRQRKIQPIMGLDCSSLLRI